MMDEGRVDPQKQQMMGPVFKEGEVFHLKYSPKYPVMYLALINSDLKMIRLLQDQMKLFENLDPHGVDFLRDIIIRSVSPLQIRVIQEGTRL
jgi:hypothetical protein